MLVLQLEKFVFLEEILNRIIFLRLLALFGGLFSSISEKLNFLPIPLLAAFAYVGIIFFQLVRLKKKIETRNFRSSELVLWETIKFCLEIWVFLVFSEIGNSDLINPLPLEWKGMATVMQFFHYIVDLLLIVVSAHSLTGWGPDMGLLTPHGRWIGGVFPCFVGMAFLVWLVTRGQAKIRKNELNDLQPLNNEVWTTFWVAAGLCILWAVLFKAFGMSSWAASFANAVWTIGNCGFAYEPGQAIAEMRDKPLLGLVWSLGLIVGTLGVPVLLWLAKRIFKFEVPENMVAPLYLVRFVAWCTVIGDLVGWILLMISGLNPLEAWLTFASDHTGGFMFVPDYTKLPNLAHCILIIGMAWGTEPGSYGGGGKYPAWVTIFGGAKIFPFLAETKRESRNQLLTFFGTTLASWLLAWALVPELGWFNWLHDTFSWVTNTGYMLIDYSRLSTGHGLVVKFIVIIGMLIGKWGFLNFICALSQKIEDSNPNAGRVS